MAVWTRDSISPKGLLSWCLATVTETKVKAGAFAKKKKKTMFHPCVDICS